LFGFCGNIYKFFGNLDDPMPYYAGMVLPDIQYLFQNPKIANRWRKQLFAKCSEVPIESSFWNIFEELHVPYFEIYLQSNFETAIKDGKRHYSHYAYSEDWMIRTGHNLKAIGFDRFYDAKSCFQEIQQFLCNLAEPEKPIPQLSNNDKIFNAGFDLKASFRTPKS
jgi:hypothetical protein